ncbi:MAG: tetratricopeptide repeat protein [Proteobacteria bacterium]|nr:tetratricopeptide repeat protein [Pseudomonadota bacterium]
MVKLQRHFFCKLFYVLFIPLSVLFMMDVWKYKTIRDDNRYVLSLLQDEHTFPEIDPSSRSPERWFVYASALVREQHYDKAAEAYSQASRLADDHLNVFIYYNLGNLYLKQAVEQAEKSGLDSAMAFTDTAKAYYRRSLRFDPGFLKAKFNYETAQRLVRDLPLGKVRDGAGEEDVPEDLWSAMPGFPIGLP